jgi:hypothetical protein
MNEYKLYFDEAEHKYTDVYGNAFTSVTTCISKYYDAFDKVTIAKACEKIGRNPRHPKYLKYKGKSFESLLKEWEKETIRACEKGTIKHDFLEQIIKESNNFNRVKANYSKGRIFTIADIKVNPLVGQITIDKLVELGLLSKYPSIYDLIKSFTDNDWKIYAEIGVYNLNYLISGLIDILLVKGNEFVILDWKTNKAPIKFESGYYEKDLKGNLQLNNYILDGKTFNYPLQHLSASSGYKYSLQLSTYAYLTENFGFKSKGIILCHIRGEDNDTTIEFLPIKFMKSEIKLMLDHHISNIAVKTQNKLF